MFFEPRAVVDLVSSSSDEEENNGGNPDNNIPGPQEESNVVNDVEGGRARIHIRGPPQALPRNFVVNGRTINPATSALRAFRKKILEGFVPLGIQVPLYQPNVPVSVKLWHFLARPETDFVGRRRKAGNLKPEAKERTVTLITPDVDNLVKFALDALVGVAYSDDRQVVELVAYKARDNVGKCNGGTLIELREYTGSSHMPAGFEGL